MWKAMMKVIVAVTIVVGFASSITTMGGFHKMLEFSSNRGPIAVLWALSTWFMITAVWMVYYFWFSKCDPKRQLYMLILLAPAIAIIFGVSTIFSVMHIGETDVKKAHMEKCRSQAEQSVADIGAFIESEAAIEITLAFFEDQFGALAVFDEEEGGTSGIAGRDVVVNQLLALKLTSGNLREKIATSLKRKRQHLENARREGERMGDTINDEEMTLVQKDVAFRSILSNLNNYFRQIQGLDITAFIGEIVRRMDVLSPAGQPKNQELMDGQKKGLSEVYNLVAEVKDILTKELDKRKRMSQELPELRAMSLQEGIFVYWHRIPAAWAGGIGFDFINLFFFLAIYLTTPARKEEEEKEKDLEQRAAHEAMKR